MADVDPGQQPGPQPQQQPYYQQPPQQPYQAPNAYQQQYQQPAPPTGAEMQGSHKAAWFFIGMFTGVAGILIASMVNVDKPYRSEGTKWAVIGCFFWIAVTVIFFVGGCSAAFVASSMPY